VAGEINIKLYKNKFVNNIMTTCSICYEEFEKSGDRILDFKCYTKNCECVICNNCVVNIYDNQSDSEHFKCPLCRQICYKEYFSTVVLGIEFKIKMEEKKQKMVWRVNFLKEQRDRINRQLNELEILINF
tara:strand:+ start:196 stop:585 length:390 start_codon:yes stop_codon:yes gene_type:complete